MQTATTAHSLRLFAVLAALGFLSPVGAATPTEAPAMFIFPAGSTKLTQDSLDLIDRLAKRAKAHVANWIILEGCGDAQGSPELNLALLQQRLATIEREIVARGMPQHRVRNLTTREGCGTPPGLKHQSVAARIERHEP